MEPVGPDGGGNFKLEAGITGRGFAGPRVVPKQKVAAAMYTDLYPNTWMKRGLVVAVLVGSTVEAFQPSPALFSGGMKLRSARSKPISMAAATAAPSKFEAMRKKYSRFSSVHPCFHLL
jgi:hypothetical protein